MTTNLVTRVLLTGGAGFIGSHLIDALIDRGYEIRILDNLTTGSLGNITHREAVEFARGDVRNPSDVRNAMEDIDIVFHLAGIVGMRLAHELSNESCEIADVGTANVLAAAAGRPCVLMSSSCVYGLRHAGICSEDDLLSEGDILAYDGGLRGYSYGKHLLERHGERAAEDGAPVLIVRPFNVVGPRQSPEYGMVIPRLVRQALQGKPLTVYGDGSQSRCFSDVSAFVASLLRVADVALRQGGVATRINLGSAQPTSILALATAIRDLTGGVSDITMTPYSDIFPGRSDVQWRVPCTRRLDALLGDRLQWPAIDVILRKLLPGGSDPSRAACAGVPQFAE